MAEDMEWVALYVDAFRCGVADWWKIWGDPILSGTVFVASYLGVAALTLRAAPQATGRERWLWRLCGFFFLFQALNTPLACTPFRAPWVAAWRMPRAGMTIGSKSK
jgi:hypothetical protein